MNRLFSALSLFMSLLSIPASAQVEADIIRPSVNANQFSLDEKCPSLEPLIEAKTGIKVPTAVKQTEIPDKIRHEIRKFHKKQPKCLLESRKMPNFAP